tara:strand:- start:21220 stop:21564 length:345 start_codon:yes stop_codon:yes gene_type:complete
MSTAHETIASVSHPAPEDLSARVARLERSNSRWKLAAVALFAGGVGLVAGGLAQPDAVDEPEFGYASVGETIYRIDQKGDIEYINVNTGFRSAEGYVSWGKVRLDRSRTLKDKP